MILRRNAEKQILTLPIRNGGNAERLRIIRGTDSMTLSVSPGGPADWDYLLEYPLPFPPEETVLEAEESVFRFLSWKDSVSAPSGAVRNEPFRQRFHFSPEKGWMNDPNGLCFLNGEWHLFFQYNPFSSNWGNMHWNHAVSSDLIHWRERGIVLYPDSEGTMFSGSAVIDRNNAAGFGKDAMLLFYTNAHYTGGTATQNLAYSVDGGKTFRKYDRNPLIPNISGFCDRDPQVAFDPEAGCWRMCLYLGNEERKEFLLFRSDDLLHWEKTDLYRIPGGRECPGIRRMRDEATGEWKWLFTEANGFYRIGRIGGTGKIEFECESRRFLYGDAYAGQIFHGTAEEETVFLAWLRMPGGACRTYSGCMTLPMSLHLCGGRLLVRPYGGVRGILPVKGVPFESETGLCLTTPEKRIHLDLPHRILRIQEKETVLSGEFPTRLRGRLYADRVSMEYFDESGEFMAAFFLPGAEEAEETV